MSELFDGARLIDQCALARRTRHLGPKAFRAYFALTEYYWEAGALFGDDRHLAQVCQLSLQSFRGVREQLARMFRVDGTGLWRDYRLERERAAAIVAADLDPADFAPPPPSDPNTADDGGTRSPRSIAGQRNAEERWARERARQAAELAAREAAVAERERQVADLVPARDGFDIAVGMPVGIVSHANAMPNGMPTDAKSHAVSIGLARSHLARPSDEEEEEDSRKTSSSSSSKPSRTGDANAAPDAKFDADRHAKPAGGTMPTGDAKPAGGAAAPRARPALSDAELRDALVSAIGGKVEPGCRDPGQVGPIRALIAEGCDLDLHIVPELRALASSSKPLKTWRAPWLRDQIRARRDRPAETGHGAPAAPLDFVADGSPQWAPCQDREVAEGRPRKKPIHEKAGQKGAWFPTPLPPAARPSIAAE